MKFDQPAAHQIPQLLQLWKDVFGDHQGFWELFLDTAFLPGNCRCLLENDQITAALYWFDCGCGSDKIAYIYGVVTHPDHRGKGLCRKLMENTHAHLRRQGYDSVLLVPESEGLRQMYRKMGYQDCTAVSEFSCNAGDVPVTVRSVDAEEYARLRQNFLPEKGVIQEGWNLTFLAAQAQLYAGEDFLLAAYALDDTLHGMELLGNREAAPGILRALQFSHGLFRTPGNENPFAMFHGLTSDAVTPEYFGFAFD